MRMSPIFVVIMLSYGMGMMVLLTAYFFLTNDLNTSPSGLAFIGVLFAIVILGLGIVIRAYRKQRLVDKRLAKDGIS